MNNTIKMHLDINRAKQYACIKTGKNEGYFNNNPLDGDQKYTVNDICKLTKLLVDWIIGSLLFQVAQSMEYHW